MISSAIFERNMHGQNVICESPGTVLTDTVFVMFVTKNDGQKKIVKDFTEFGNKFPHLTLKLCTPSNDIENSFTPMYPCLIAFKDSVALTRHFGPWDTKTLLVLVEWVGHQVTKKNHVFKFPMTSLIPINSPRIESFCSEYETITFNKPDLTLTQKKHSIENEPTKTKRSRD